MISGVNSKAGNIFSNSDDMMSRVRSGNGSSSEAHLRGLSRKDAMSSTNIAKDEIEYQIDDMMWEQNKELDKEEWDRLGDLFQ